MDIAALRDQSTSKSSNDGASASTAGQARPGQRKKAAAKGILRDGATNTETFLAVSVPSGSSNVKVQATTVTKSDGTRTAKFSLPGDPLHAYEGGVALVFQKYGQKATISWYLDSQIASLSSTSPLLQFSAASGGVQSLRTEADQYATLAIPFLVNFITGDLHDPQIVVTPIGNVQQAKAAKGKAAPAKAAKGKAPAKAPAKAAKGKAAPAKAAKGAPKRGGAAAKGKKR